MPMHDWTRVDAGIYHHFHNVWILEIHAILMNLLPPEYYALSEQKAAGFEGDVLALAVPERERREPPSAGSGTATLARPRARVFQESPQDFYQRKQKVVAIRHVSGDRIVAIVEVVSPANKNSVSGIRSFVTKVRELLDRGIHQLIVDPFPPDTRNPFGLHALIGEAFLDEPFRLPVDQPLSAISYECGGESIRTYLEPFAVGDALATMPIYLTPGFYVEVPLEVTYLAAWRRIPERWRAVLEAPIDPVGN